MSSPSEVIPEIRMSAFVALIGLRRYLRDHPNTPTQDAANSLKCSDADFAAADFEGALRLHEQLPNSIDFTNPRVSLREGLAILIEANRPWWCRLFPYGRQRLATALTQDEFQTFRSAGLFEECPTSASIEWWDRFATLVRAEENERMNAQGRHAEMLSMEYEGARLSSLGIAENPRWVALDDNSTGYDIRSFEHTPYGLKNLLIEVKSSLRSPPRMVLTRGEWDTAVKYGEAYIFHFWKLPAEELVVMTAAQIAAHIPVDYGNGRWTEVEIRF